MTYARGQYMLMLDINSSEGIYEETQSENHQSEKHTQIWVLREMVYLQLKMQF